MICLFLIINGLKALSQETNKDRNAIGNPPEPDSRLDVRYIIIAGFTLCRVIIQTNPGLPLVLPHMKRTLNMNLFSFVTNVLSVIIFLS